MNQLNLEDLTVEKLFDAQKYRYLKLQQSKLALKLNLLKVSLLYISYHRTRAQWLLRWAARAKRGTAVPGMPLSVREGMGCQSPSNNVVWAEAYTSIPSGILMHPAVWPQ